MKILVGTFYLGHENVRLFVLPDEAGGSFTLAPKDKGHALIEVGLDYDDWDGCVDVLLHETFEMAATRCGARFAPDTSTTHDHARYLFSFSHAQFCQICAAQSWFVAAALPRIHPHWKKAKARGVRKKK